MTKGARYPLRLLSLTSFLLFLPPALHAAEDETAEEIVQKSKVNFTEKKASSGNAYLDAQHRSTAEKEAAGLSGTQLIESARLTYQKYNNRVRVPAFISASPIPQVARIIGPKMNELSFRIGDTIYMRWSGAPLPKVGDRFSAFTPAVVLQNLANPTDFDVFDMPSPTTKLPEERRLAGYFYESQGTVRVMKTTGGLVEGSIESMSGRIGVGDELMQRPPLVENITPINSGIQISAAVVCGSPVERLSTTKRSIIFLNRGSRDGIRVGRVFESVDTVPLDEAVGGAAPAHSNGEAIVIHVTDAYSTAMITKQFDVIRIGSLLRTKQEETPLRRNAPFEGFSNEHPETASAPVKLPEIPSADKLPGASDESLPEPRKRPSGPPLSELDLLEKDMQLKSLTPAEKARLDKLSRQEKLGDSQEKETLDELSETPGVPAVENSFKQGKPTAKKETGKKKKPSKNDEEELNLLMMQN
jgi:hypothetical protein